MNKQRINKQLNKNKKMSQNSRLLKIAQKIAVEVGIDKQLNVEPKEASLVMVSIIEDINFVHQVRYAVQNESSEDSLLSRDSKLGELVRELLAEQTK